MKKFFLSLLFSLFLLAPAHNSGAQVFDDEEDKSTLQPKVQPAASASSSNAWLPAQEPKAEAKPAAQEELFMPEQKTPQLSRPTLDGVARGRISMSPVVTKQNAGLVKDDELIFIYYKDFAIERLLSGMVTCDVTFVVLTTLDRKLSNISFKLKWPTMTTSLSYDDVAPNTETIYRYTLLGDGCYSMDKIPNIIVNRCRVKDTSQQACAGKIRWLRK